MAGVPERILLPSESVGNVTPLPGVSDAAYGTGLGAAIAAAGGELHGSRVRALRAEKQRQEESAAAEAGKAAAQASLDVDSAINDLEEHAAPGAEGHVQAATHIFDEHFGEVLVGIKDPRVRERFSVNIAEQRVRVIHDADSWFRGARQKHGVDNINEAADLSANHVMGHPDEAVFGEALSNLATTIGAQGLSADLTKRLVQEKTEVIGVGYATGMIHVDPAAALRILGSDYFDGILSPKTRAVLINQAETGVRIAAAALSAQQAREKAAFVDDASAFRSLVAGGDMPADTEFDQRIAQAEGYGDQSLATQLRLDKQETHIRRDTHGWTPPQWEQAIDALEAKGDKRTTEENVRLQTLQKYRPAAEAKFNGDPHRFAAGIGMPSPAIDWTSDDPADGRQRLTWARSVQQSARMQFAPVLDTNEAATFQRRAGEGTAGQLEVAATLRAKFGVAGASLAAQQIKGDFQPTLKVMVGLNDRGAALYRLGADALKRNDKIFDKGQAQAIFAEFRPAIPPEIATAMFDVAKNVVAGMADEKGIAQLQDEEFANAFRGAIHRVAGMTGAGPETKGGFARWNGRYAWLPPDVSRDDFQKRMSRASKADWIRAAGGEPYYMGSDGKLTKLNDTQLALLGKYRLETVNPGLYNLIGPDGGHLFTSDHRSWQLDIRKLPSAFNAALAAHGYVRR